MIYIEKRKIEHISRLVHEYSGIVVERVTTRQVEKKIADQMQHFKVNKVDDYIHILETCGHNPLPMDDLIADLTVSESYFFRNPGQFAYMLEVLLPEFFARHGGRFPCRIWSAGCSRGEEAYSIAMLVKHYQNKFPEAKFNINAGDINSRNLQMAREAVFSSRSLRDKLSEFEERLGFLPGDKDSDGNCTISQDLRQMVEFQRLNLKNIQSLKCLTGSDIIFCRNVLIYFDDSLRSRLFEEFFRYLNPGGVVFLGESECIPAGNYGFETINHNNSYAYRKPVAKQGK
ncbi:MAG TPA: protein-glutamate O-methyltransferase CheR [Candidatus Rifleibacterium sp.]|nr:protein-glutamate O-methyltransferase CheR [Candidatus Rifleibacterium sp.]